jgi:hypothetical protein
LDPRKILVSDMTAILAQVSRDPVPANARNNFRGAHRIGVFTPACIADGGNMIDIDPEP